MATRRKGTVRAAFDRSVNAAKKESDDTKLQTELDAGLVAAGRNIADHLDGINNELANAVVKAQSMIEEAYASGDIDPLQLSRALESLDKISERAGKAVFLTPHLMNILREMYATPKSRAELLQASEKAKRDAMKHANNVSGGGHLQGLKGGRAV